MPFDFFSYARKVRLSQAGTLLHPSQKLVLLLLAASIDETGLCSLTKDALAEESLISVRQVKRILSELVEMELIKPVPQLTDRGQDAPSKYKIILQGEGVTDDILQPGRVTSSVGESVKQQRESVAHDTLPSMSPMTPYPTIKPSKINSLDDSSSGTLIALFPSPSFLNKNGGGEVVESVRIWFEKTGAQEITPKGAELIRDKVYNSQVWSETLDGWLASGWSTTNIAGQVERYEKNLTRLPYSKKPPSPSITPIAQESREENERYRKIIYGEENL